MRNHNTMKRDAIIKMIAGLVGQPHRVDLKNYDLLITVEIYQVGILQATGEMLR
jgi:tRNA acetyltransferase TAN1